MSTRRERLEAKLEKREEWAEKAEARSEARFATADRMASVIPMGQPILVGHYSEKRDRNYRARIHSNMDKACEEAALAKHHEAKAAGLERQLESSIFSDDSDAIEKLEEKIKALEAKQVRMKAVNAAIRKNAKAGTDAQVAALVAMGLSAALASELLKPDFCGRIGYADYATKNNGAEIRRAKARIEEVKRRNARTAEAEAAGGVVIKASTDYATITFAERPEWSIIEALKAAGFFFRGGSWFGQTAKIPADVSALATPNNTNNTEAQNHGN